MRIDNDSFESVRKGLGRIFVRAGVSDSWKLSGGCFKVAPSLFVTLYHMCHDFVRVNEKNVEGKHGTPKWRPLEVAVLLEGKQSPTPATVCNKSKEHDLVLVRVDVASSSADALPLSFAPQPVRLMDELAFCSFPLPIDAGKTLSTLPWTMTVNPSSITGIDDKHLLSSYPCFQGSCGYPVVSLHNGQVIGVHCGMLWLQAEDTVTVLSCDDVPQRVSSSAAATEFTTLPSSPEVPSVIPFPPLSSSTNHITTQDDHDSGQRDSFSSAGSVDDPKLLKRVKVVDAAEKCHIAQFIPITIVISSFQKELAVAQKTRFSCDHYLLYD